MLFAVLGIASAIVFIIGDIPYLLDALNAKTRPHRVTWGIIALSNAIGFANQYASGANNSLWLFGAGAIVTGAIFVISLRNGVGGRTNTDIFCLAVSLLGIILWATLKSPLYSIIANIIGDVAAFLPSFKKARKNPESETRISWLIGGLSSLLATISVGKLDWQLLVLPGAAVILQAYMIYILYLEAA